MTQVLPVFSGELKMNDEIANNDDHHAKGMTMWPKNRIGISTMMMTTLPCKDNRADHVKSAVHTQTLTKTSFSSQRDAMIRNLDRFRGITQTHFIGDIRLCRVYVVKNSPDTSPKNHFRAGFKLLRPFLPRSGSARRRRSFSQKNTEIFAKWTIYKFNIHFSQSFRPREQSLIARSRFFRTLQISLIF